MAVVPTDENKASRRIAATCSTGGHKIHKILTKKKRGYGGYYAYFECIPIHRCRYDLPSTSGSFLFLLPPLHRFLLLISSFTDDDDEFDEDAIPAMAHPGAGIPVTPLSSSTSPARLSANTKGKGRAVGTPSPSPLPFGPSSQYQQGGNTLGSTTGLSGNIGAPNNPTTTRGANGSGPTGFGSTTTSGRQWIGGIQLETRCISRFSSRLWCAWY